VPRLPLLFCLLLAPTFAWAAPPRRQICVPFADRVLAWDAEADLYVVATYLQRDTIADKTNLPPNLLELRRISTGAQRQLVNCALHADELGSEAMRGPCDFRVEFGRYLNAQRFRQHGTRVELGRLKVVSVEDDGSQGTVLMARVPGKGWQRVAWLEQQPVDAPEKVTVRLVGGERWGDNVDLVVSRRQRGGDCSHTSVRMLRLRAADLEAPAAPERQAHLLGQLSSSSSFAAWRTAAELAPLPPERLLIGMAVAEESGLPQFAARWWQQTTAQLPVERLAPLVAGVRDRPELAETRQLIKLPEGYTTGQ
jgi:hypothetical protein